MGLSGAPKGRAFVYRALQRARRMELAREAILARTLTPLPLGTIS